MDPEVEAFLAHYGIKGMRWGVRKQRLLELHTRVGSGKGSTRDKLRARSEMSVVDMARHKGSVESYSREQAAKLSAQKERDASGKSTRADKLDLFTNLYPNEIIKPSRKPQ